MNGFHAFQIPFSRVTSIHPLQNIAISRLHGQVDVFADIFVLGHHFEHVVGHVLRVAGGKANTKVRIDMGNTVNQFCKTDHRLLLIFDDALVVNVPFVAVYVLAQQRHFTVTRFKQLLCLTNDAFRIAAPLSSSRKWHNTEAAHIITAAHDAYECCHTIGIQAHRTDFRIRLFSAQQNVHRFLSTVHLVDKVGEIAIRVRSHHQIYQFFLLQ